MTLNSPITSFIKKITNIIIDTKFDNEEETSITAEGRWHVFTINLVVTLNVDLTLIGELLKRNSKDNTCVSSSIAKLKKVKS